VDGSASHPCGAIAMQLRHYSEMRFREAPNWPPLWVRLGRAHAKTPKTRAGEIGILKEALLHRSSRQNLFDNRS
jgi:hypothetical protein